MLSGKASKESIVSENKRNTKNKQNEKHNDMSILPITRFAASSSFFGSITVLSYFREAIEKNTLSSVAYSASIPKSEGS
jgi:hypothetical protein